MQISRLHGAVSALPVSALLMLTGCYQPAGEEVLDRARTAAGNGDWTAALADAKRYTIDNPQDSAGHYLLGQAYFYSPRPNLEHARGEMHMAFNLFREQNDWSVFQDEGMPADAYELALRKDMARVHLRWILEAIQARIPPEPILERIAQCREHIRRGLLLNPDDSQFAALKVNLRDLEAMLNGGRRPQLPGEITAQVGNGRGDSVH